LTICTIESHYSLTLMKP